MDADYELQDVQESGQCVQKSCMNRLLTSSFPVLYIEKEIYNLVPKGMRGISNVRWRCKRFKQSAIIHTSVQETLQICKALLLQKVWVC